MRDNGLAKVLALAAQLGFAIACPMVLFIGGGAWLDNKLGWTPWLLFVGIALGLLTAGGLFYQLAMASGRSQDPAARKAPYKVEQQGNEKDPGTPRANRSDSNGQ
jgi:hypothetical protein